MVRAIKRTWTMLLCLVIVIGLVPALGTSTASANTEFAGGSGTAEDPFQITTIVHLNNIRNKNKL